MTREARRQRGRVVGAGLSAAALIVALVALMSVTGTARKAGAGPVDPSPGVFVVGNTSVDRTSLDNVTAGNSSAATVFTEPVGQTNTLSAVAINSTATRIVVGEVNPAGCGPLCTGVHSVGGLRRSYAQLPAKHRRLRHGSGQPRRGIRPREPRGWVWHIANRRQDRTLTPADPQVVIRTVVQPAVRHSQFHGDLAGWRRPVCRRRSATSPVTMASLPGTRLGVQPASPASRKAPPSTPIVILRSRPNGQTLYATGISISTVTNADLYSISPNLPGKCPSDAAVWRCWF